MDRGFRFLCQAETKKLLAMLGITIAFVLGVQNAELPYTRVIASVFTSGRISSFTMGSSKSIHGLDEIASSPESSKLDLGKGSITAPASGPAPEKAAEPEHAVVFKNFTTSDEASLVSSVKDVDLALQGVAPSSIPPTTMASLPDRTSVDSVKASRSPMMPVTSKATSTEPGTENTAPKNEKSGSLKGNKSKSNNNKPMTSKKSKKRPSRVVPISEMNKLLQQSHSSSQLMKPRRSSAVDKEITHAKSEIENAPIIESDSRLYSPVYRNASMFKRSYELMEEILKVYIYSDGDKPIFHEYLLDGIYSSEGWFMKLLEANKPFVTKDPGKAQLFYIPFSSRLLQLTLYVRNSHSRSNLIEYMKNHVDMIAQKYPFWNRTNGADHFVVACHDWAPAETRGRLLNSIRALCNADIDVGFKIGKDVSLPETYVVSAENPLRNIGGNPPSERPILAFFAGGLHGYVRPILLKHWENKEPDMKISGPLPHVRGNANYLQLMKSSKYCICARGHEVNSPRVVEAFFHECVPVIISDNFIPPFFEVLNWESFAVFVMEKDIPNLRNILLSISEERYLEMHKRVKMAQQHFLWHAEPVKYDLFHMILHSIWYSRLFRIRST